MDQIVGVSLGLDEKPKINFGPRGQYAGMDLRSYALYQLDLSCANFDNCNMEGMNLSNCSLNKCSFQNANLTGVILRDASMYGCDITSAKGIVGGIVRSDGHTFYGVLGHGHPLMIKAGCRWFDLATARNHWYQTETMAILDCLEALAKARTGREG